VDPESMDRVSTTVSTLQQRLDELRRAGRADRVRHAGWARRDAELAADYRALQSQLRSASGAAGRVELGPAPEAHPAPEAVAAELHMAGETADPVAVDDAPARLATATATVRQLVEICAFLDPAAPLPLDRLTAAVGLLPPALQRAADDDVGLGAVLDAARERQLLAGAGVAARMHEQTSAAIRAALHPDAAAEAWRHAALLVLAAPAPPPGEPVPESPPDPLPQHARHLAEQQATGRDVLVEMLREL
jgi:hypothetical protein